MRKNDVVFSGNNNMIRKTQLSRHMGHLEVKMTTFYFTNIRGHLQ